LCAAKDVVEPEARAAFVWMLGTHGDAIQDAPYLLEALAEGFDGEEPCVSLWGRAGALWVWGVVVWLPAMECGCCVRLPSKNQAACFAC
jgi:hypothetical protein